MSQHISEQLRQRIRDSAGNRCGYCLSPQNLVLGTLEIEHIEPRSQGGASAENNLWLACRLCNNFKSDQTVATDHLTAERVTLFNPRQQTWDEHFQWSEDGTRILGKTACGRATIIAMQLNNIVAVTVRQHWVAAGWHPPQG